MPRRLVLLLFAPLLLQPLVAQDRLTDVTNVGTEMREDDLPSIAVSGDGSVWLTWLSYSDRRDEVALRQWHDGTWGNLQYVPNTSGDSWLPQVAVDAQGRPCVVWSQMLDQNWDLYQRCYDPQGEAWDRLERLTEDPGPDINPRLVDDGAGRFAVVWQGFRQGNYHVLARSYEDGRWSDVARVSGGPANQWEPAAAFDSTGKLWVAYDSYQNGNYDVFLAGLRDGEIETPAAAVAATPLFEARPTVAVDANDGVWVAYEAGGANWGKDTGYTLGSDAPGVRLGADRSVHVRRFANGRLEAPASPLQEVFSAGAGDPKWTYQPHLFIDDAGGLWAIAKRLIRITREGVGTRGYWEYWSTRYDGDRWRPAEPIPNSWGRSSTRLDAAVGPDQALWLTWPTDNRTEAYAHRPRDGQVYVGKIAREPSVAARLVEPPAVQVQVKEGHANEPADLDAIRGYRTTVDGRPVQIVRGDFHRHTELSWDGGGGTDGSLQDFYRYMIDAAAMDFGASTDHQGGAYDYWWWYSQKMTDMYHTPPSYLPIFGFERSVTQPNGHRNIFYADRSGEVVPFFMKNGVDGFALGRHPTGDLPPVGTGAVVDDDTQHLYDAIRRMNGIAISHTSGTRMGTTWRHNDPELEPVVEIFQGARSNYEYLGAPLTVQEARDDAHMARAGYVPEGYVVHAWNKGYRLGIITSSDHNSTHYSYAMVYTDRPTREGVLDAIRRRHTYGATDNIVLDVRMGEHFMGDEFYVAEPLPLEVKVRGTSALGKVHVLRNAAVIYTHEPGGAQEASFEFVDRDPPREGDAPYYYVRVEQADGQVAWSSPMWIHYAANEMR